MDALTAEQAAYLAGVIDGEGHLAIVRAVKASGGSPRFGFVAKITNTKREWLEELQTWIGGRVYQTGASPKRLNSRPCFDLRLIGAEARAMLTQIRPYVRLKSRHVDLLLRYFEVAAMRRASNLPGQLSDPSIIAELDQLHVEMKSINLRGLHQTWHQGGPHLHRQCRLDGCERPHLSNGYCKTHYKKHVERGGPAWHERACVQCGKPFVSKRSDAICCSRRCVNRHGYLDRKRVTGRS